MKSSRGLGHKISAGCWGTGILGAARHLGTEPSDRAERPEPSYGWREGGSRGPLGLPATPTLDCVPSVTFSLA